MGRTAKLRKRKKMKNNLVERKAQLCKEITGILEDYRINEGIDIGDVGAGRFKCDSFGNLLHYYDNFNGKPILEVRKMKMGKDLCFHVTVSNWEAKPIELQKEEAIIEEGNEETPCKA